MSDDHIASTLSKTILDASGSEDCEYKAVQTLYALGWTTERIVENEFAIGGVQQVFWYAGKFLDYLRCAAQTDGNGRSTRYSKVFMKYGSRLTKEMREILFSSVDDSFLREIKGDSRYREHYEKYLEEQGESEK